MLIADSVLHPAAASRRLWRRTLAIAVAVLTGALVVSCGAHSTTPTVTPAMSAPNGGTPTPVQGASVPTAGLPDAAQLADIDKALQDITSSSSHAASTAAQGEGDPTK